ncbi:MAG: hypothetical protein V3S94_05205 [Gammaproteobacteria bacterium]
MARRFGGIESAYVTNAVGDADFGLESTRWTFADAGSISRMVFSKLVVPAVGYYTQIRSPVIERIVILMMALAFVATVQAEDRSVHVDPVALTLAARLPIFPHRVE